MKFLSKILSYYFIFALPLLFITWLIWPSISREELAIGSSFLEWGNTIFGAIFAGWIITAIYIALSLLISSHFREQLLKRITFMRERDEREEMIVGKSARNVFLFNLAFLILLFILNLVNINVTKLPPEKVIQGKEHNLFLGLNYYPIRQATQDSTTLEDQKVGSVFRYDFPITVSGILTILILTNIGSFYYYSRRAERGQNT